MIDLHAHILPGVDDGPASLAQSVTLARAAVAAGTRVLVATSHVSHMFATDPGVFPDRLAAVRAALAEHDVALDVRSGGELAPSRLVELDDDTLAALSLGGGPYLLVECPFSPVATELEAVVWQLQQDGWRVLLAHPERSYALHREPRRLADLVDAGALVQVTAGSLTGQFGRTARRFAVEALRDGLVHVLASDAHDPVERPPGLQAARREVGGLGAWLTEEVPAAILAGEPLPERPRKRALRRA